MPKKTITIDPKKDTNNLDWVALGTLVLSVISLMVTSYLTYFVTLKWAELSKQNELETRNYANKDSSYSDIIKNAIKSFDSESFKSEYRQQFRMLFSKAYSQYQRLPSFEEKYSLCLYATPYECSKSLESFPAFMWENESMNHIYGIVNQQEILTLQRKALILTFLDKKSDFDKSVISNRLKISDEMSEKIDLATYDVLDPENNKWYLVWKKCWELDGLLKWNLDIHLSDDERYDCYIDFDKFYFKLGNLSNQDSEIFKVIKADFNTKEQDARQ